MWKIFKWNLLNFTTNFEKTGIFVNNFMKHNIKSGQEITDN